MTTAWFFRVHCLATQQRAHAVHQLADRFEWFRHNIIGAHAPGLGLVDRLVRPDQKHNRNPAEPFTPFDKPAQFITTDAGHVGVREDHIGGGLPELFQCGLAVAYRGDLHPLIGEGETKEHVMQRVVDRFEVFIWERPDQWYAFRPMFRGE